MNIDIAVGEVPWERELLSALAAHPDLDIGRRLVDLATIDNATTPLIACPSVRGFTEDHIRRLMTHRPVIIVVDSIRPPWLLEQHIAFHDARTVDFADVVAACANVDPSPRLQLVQQPNRGRITAFVGVSGGVGVSTLVWMYGQRNPGALLIDANPLNPSLALLAKGDRDSYLAAMREHQRSGTIDLAASHRASGNRAAVLTLPLDRDVRHEFQSADRWRFLVAAAEQYDDVVLDAGELRDDRELLTYADRIVIVTTATPLGLVRLCAHAGAVQQQELVVVVNRVRESAAGSRHAAGAITDLVRTELGCTPLLIPELVAQCDRGWLTGEWDRTLVDHITGLQQVIGSNDVGNSAFHRLPRAAGE